jgi:hypothetical protein
LKVLYNFLGGTDGETPFLAPAFDAHGDLIGTTYYGGAVTGNVCYGQCGTVYKLAPQSGAWKESILHRFGLPGDGYNPIAAVTIDATGHIYGTTKVGGGGSGSAWEVTP